MIRTGIDTVSVASIDAATNLEKAVDEFVRVVGSVDVPTTPGLPT